MEIHTVISFKTHLNNTKKHNNLRTTRISPIHISHWNKLMILITKSSKSIITIKYIIIRTSRHKKWSLHWTIHLSNPIHITINCNIHNCLISRYNNRSTTYTKIWQINRYPSKLTPITNWRRNINHYINPSKLSIDFFSLIRCIFTFKNIRNSTNHSLSVKWRILLISRHISIKKYFTIHVKWN